MADGEPLDNWQAQMRKGWLEVAILAILWGDRMYGLEIIRRLEERSDLVVAEGTVYPVLTRLRAEGLIESEWEESDSGHPRKYYSLTATGRKRTILLARQSSDFLGKMLALVKPLAEEKHR
jgi:PadR family transcriptional regulator, regulatory protein PadR